MPTAHHRPLALLGGLSAQAFLRDYWQKKPLVIRSAYQPHWISKEQVFQLGAYDDIEARLVSYFRKRWRVSFGPQRELPRQQRDWTLLVQGVNLRHQGAAALLQRLDFLPFWRLDDVMLSYAVPGGGVGPHLDSYDVFLLQVAGTRRWRVSAQKDVSLCPGLPLKILANFNSEQEWLLEPGDMLYLPPGLAHEGTAVSECMTASLGFRAPSYQELNSEFLHYMADRLELGGRYSDKGRSATVHPGEIDDHLVDAACASLLHKRLNRTDVIEFLGCYLSEPKSTVFFEPPSHTQWKKLVKRITQGVVLDPRTILLYRGRLIFINGELLAATGAERRLLSRLADRRALTSKDLESLSPALLGQIGDWLKAGWLNLMEEK